MYVFKTTVIPPADFVLIQQHDLDNYTNIDFTSVKYYRKGMKSF